MLLRDHASRPAMHAFLVLVLTSAELSSSATPSDWRADSSSLNCGANGIALIQRKHLQSSPVKFKADGKSLGKQDQDMYPFPPLVRPHNFIGASPVVSEQPCVADSYEPSPLESQWAQNALAWTGESLSHCEHMLESQAEEWIHQNEYGNFDTQLFSKVCRKGKVPQFIEPLAGILRDPRFHCYGRDAKDLYSVDWLVFPDKQATAGGKARFYDAGGTTFHEALKFFLDTYKAHGILFDEVFVWEFEKQGTESYWKDVDSEVRAFWEPRLTFYDGIPVTQEIKSENNPVHRIFTSCTPEDFCAFKLDIDTPVVEQALIMQFLDAPNETTAKLDELFFEQHVGGPAMHAWWGDNVLGTFADSYRLFGALRQLGVRAHSWV